MASPSKAELLRKELASLKSERDQVRARVVALSIDRNSSSIIAPPSRVSRRAASVVRSAGPIAPRVPLPSILTSLPAASPARAANAIRSKRAYTG